MHLLPLDGWHRERGAKMGEFAGYAMPLYYGKPIEEHHAVRRTAGVFDISHMGQFVLEGERAEDCLQYALTNHVRAMADGEALYSPMCREDGGVLDDLIIYRVDPARFRIIVNAGNRESDLQWLEGLVSDFGVAVRDLTPERCLFAVQGPEAFPRLAPHMETPPGDLRYYAFVETRGFGAPLFLARTGYTGEPGCEISVAAADAPAVWEQLTEAVGLTPIGLAARDTLRLEACMALYGHELRAAWHPLESGLAWTVKLEPEEDFVGRAAIARAKAEGVSHRLVGLEMTGRGIAREGYPVLANGARVGEITSGALSPTTGNAVAMAHVAAAHAKLGTPLEVEIRGKAVAARVAPRPFYKNPALRA